MYRQVARRPSRTVPGRFRPFSCLSLVSVPTDPSTISDKIHSEEKNPAPLAATGSAGRIQRAHPVFSSWLFIDHGRGAQQASEAAKAARGTSPSRVGHDQRDHGFDGGSIRVGTSPVSPFLAVRPRAEHFGRYRTVKPLSLGTAAAARKRRRWPIMRKRYAPVFR